MNCANSVPVLEGVISQCNTSDGIVLPCGVSGGEQPSPKVQGVDLGDKKSRFTRMWIPQPGP